LNSSVPACLNFLSEEQCDSSVGCRTGTPLPLFIYVHQQADLCNEIYKLSKGYNLEELETFSTI